jgi:VanZ family protein
MCVTAIAVLSLLPKEHMVRTDLGGHIEHIIAYAVTALAVTYAYGATKAPRIVVALVTYAGSLELLQHFSPGRTPSIEDFMCSTIGVFVGIALFLIASRAAPAKGIGV